MWWLLKHRFQKVFSASIYLQTGYAFNVRISHMWYHISKQCHVSLCIQICRYYKLILSQYCIFIKWIWGGVRNVSQMYQILSEYSSLSDIKFGKRRKVCLLKSLRKKQGQNIPPISKRIMLLRSPLKHLTPDQSLIVLRRKCLH